MPDRAEDESLPQLLRDAAAALDEAGLAWALIGGCARNAYAEPRATRDVDLVVEVDARRQAKLDAALAARGLVPATRVGESDDAVPDLVLYRDPDGRRLDVLFAHTAFEQSALARRRRLVPFANTEAAVVSAEDLIVYKLLADRPQDRADIVAVVRTLNLQGKPLDWTYVDEWCATWEVGDRFERLRVELSLA